MSIKKVQSKRYKSGYGYQVCIDRIGMPRIRRTFETRRLAEEVEAAYISGNLRAQYGLAPDSHVTLAELIKEHLERMQKRGRDKCNLKRAETVLGRFKDIAGGARPVYSIKTADLSEYVESRYDAGVKPQTINRELTEIKACLTSAPTFYRSLEGWQSPKAPWQQEPEGGRRQTWSVEAQAAILRELYAPKRPRESDYHVQGRHAVGDMFTVAINTGMRAGEVRNLRKSDVNLAARLITVKSGKGMTSKRVRGKVREVPMNDKAYQIIKRRFESAKGECLFAGHDPDKPLSDHRKAFITACKRANIPYGLKNDGHLIFNDARRTAENEMLEAGHHARIVGDILGHSVDTMARHYARSTAQSRREAVQVLEIRRSVPLIEHPLPEAG